MSNKRENWENWQRTVEESMTHPKGIIGYARENGVSASQIYTWKSRLRRADEGQASSISPERFCRDEMVEPKRPQLPDAKWVAELILALHSGG
jgi:transposase-like protein